MNPWRFIIAIILLMESTLSAQNIIDHYSTIWPSGYGKMAFDADTLYLNTMNGHAVERYNVADPANPIFIDREEKAGFNQIDFERKIMLSVRGDSIILSDFSNFLNTDIRSIIPIYPFNDSSLVPFWKMASIYLIVAQHDSFWTYNITDISNPQIVAISSSIRPGYFPDGTYPVFGSSVCILGNNIVNSRENHFDYYDISDPGEITLLDSITFYAPILGSYSYSPLRGDTVAFNYVDNLEWKWSINPESYAPNDTSELPQWENQTFQGWPPAVLVACNGGAILFHQYRITFAYSFHYFDLLGVLSEYIPGNLQNSEITEDDYVYVPLANSVRIFQPTYSDSIIMPLSNIITQPHYGVMSCAAYSNYILSGVESNGGELLLQAIDNDGDIYQTAVLPEVPAEDIIIKNTTAFCRCSDRLVAVSLENPEFPVIQHESSGINGSLIDFATWDSLIFVITKHAYYILSYNDIGGFSLISSLEIQGGELSGIAQAQTASFLLKGDIGIVEMIRALNPSNPIIVDEQRLPQDSYTNIEYFYNSLWAFGPDGLNVVNADVGMDSVNYFGLEYFKDVRKMYVSHDSMYVSDGYYGAKVFTFTGRPTIGLTYKGGYSTGNAINQMAVVGSNIYVSDYYSLQHLRWGAPDGIWENPISQLPIKSTLEQNYPNPFNSSTSIEYSIPAGEQSMLNIYDICGRNVRTIPVKGNGNIVWNGRDEAGKPVSSGVYFYKIAGQPETARKMLLVK